MSLRERKKEQTRERIRETARHLFDERGFDAVTVAEIARAADVSEGTVFNYFATKEDLFYGQMEAFETELVDAVRSRANDESVLEALRDFIVERSAGLAEAERAGLIASAERIRASSPALQARERAIWARSARALAELLAAETGKPPDDVEAGVVANALIGVQRALVGYVRAAVTAGRTGPKLAADVKAEGTRAFALLDRGLADYARKPGS